MRTIKLLALLLTMTFPVVGEAQRYHCTTNYDGTLNITEYAGPKGEVAFPDTIDGLRVTAIGSRVLDGFAGSSGSAPNRFYTSVTIPNSVNSIGDEAFEECNQLTNVLIGNNVTNMGKGTFFSCQKLNTVNIPEGVTCIRTSTFSLCISLKNITVPSKVTSIERCAFLNCSTLTSITIPDSVTNIEDQAFCGCSSLTNVIIGNSVINIGNMAFTRCDRLTSMHIPKSVTCIGDCALHGENLTNIYFQGDAPSLGLQAFRFKNTTIYYQSGTTGWGAAFGSCPTKLWKQ